MAYSCSSYGTPAKQGKGRKRMVLGSAVLVAIILAIIFSSLMARGILPGPSIASNSYQAKKLNDFS